MSYPNLHRSILALAIAGASLHAHASTPVDISKGIVEFEEQTISGPMTVTGSFTGTGQIFEIEDSTLKGDLILDATISTTGPDEFMVPEVVAIEDSLIEGDLINKGVLSASGPDAEVLELNEVGVTGSVRNEGQITASYRGAGNPDFDMDIAGLVIDGADIGGDLENTGRIYVDGGTNDHINTVGVSLQDEPDVPTNIEGKLINSGSIVADGKNATAILIGEEVTIKGGLHNSGTIKGGTRGIHVDGAEAALDIHQSGGLLQGGTYAIDVDSNSTVNLYLAGGTIRGNINGLTHMAVTGKANFDGDLISIPGPRGKDGALDLGSKGHLVLERSHVTLQAHLEANKGSTLELKLSDGTDPTKAMLKVDGEAYFADGSQILLTPVTGFDVEGKEYLLVEADSIDDQGVAIKTSALLRVDAHEINDSQIKATVTSVEADVAEEIIAQGGGNSNAQAAISSFNGLLTQLSVDDPVYQAFTNPNADAATVAKLAEQLSPQVDGGATQAATGAQGLINGAVGARTSSMRGMASGSPFSQYGVWAQGLHSDADQGRRDGIAGYDADTSGLSIGVDGKLNDNLTLGVAYSYLDTDVKSDSGNKTDVETHAFTLYSSYEYGNLFVDGSLTYGFNDNESKRYIAGTMAKGDYDSNLLGINLGVGYGLHFGNITLEPRAETRYSRVDIDSFTEKGSSAALRQGSQRYEVFELGAGARVAGSYQLGQGVLEPEARLMAYHDFAADSARTTSSFVLGGNPFVSHGASAVRDSYEAGVGVTYRAGAVSVGASYDYIGKSGYNADVFKAQIRYDF